MIEHQIDPTNFLRAMIDRVGLTSVAIAILVASIALTGCTTTQKAVPVPVTEAEPVPPAEPEPDPELERRIVELGGGTRCRAFEGRDFGTQAG